MALIVIAGGDFHAVATAPMRSPTRHLGLLMLALVVVAIMLGFPTAFTLMGMGVFFAWLRLPQRQSRARREHQTLDLMVQRTYAVMSNDVLIAIPLFVFMGYLVERAALIDRLFQEPAPRAGARPGIARGRHGRDLRDLRHRDRNRRRRGYADGPARVSGDAESGLQRQVSAGSVTAGGCLGILIPPSVLLIVYGATAGVSVVQLYAGAFFPGPDAGAAVRRLHHRAGKAQARADAAAVRERAPCRFPTVAQVLAPRRRNASPGSPLSSAAPWASDAHGLDVSFAITLLPLLFIAGLFAYVCASTAPAVVDSIAVSNRWAGRSRWRNCRVLDRADGARNPRRAVPSRRGGARVLAAGRGEQTDARRRRRRSRAASAPVPRPSACRRRPGFWVAFAILRSARAADLLAGTSLGAARGLQDAAVVVFPARAADPRGARLDRVRPGDACRGGSGGRVRRLSLTVAYRFISHRAPAVPGRHRLTTTREVGSIVKESSFLTAKTSADGVLAVRRLIDLLGGIRVARRPGAGRALGAVARPDAAAVHDPRAVHHLHPRLAARVDRDHRHLHADLHSAAAESSASIRCSSACWSRSTCRPLSCRRRWRWPRSTSRACRHRT